ncbi:hypothetical protein V12B01_12735 [Vibrio splendidus 12B01]|nr:hypothetical protein V12B01_12735 [Vibrio splendidus 12B01]
MFCKIEPRQLYGLVTFHLYI